MSKKSLILIWSIVCSLFHYVKYIMVLILEVNYNIYYNSSDYN